MEYIIHIIILSTIYSILAMGLNLVAGYTGLFSMAHAVFYAIGAYTTAILLTRTEINFFWTILIGMLITLVVSMLIGAVMSNFREDYYAIVSLGFGAIAVAVLVNWKSLTRGAFGIAGIERPELFGYEFFSIESFLVLSFLFFAIIFCLCRFIVKSSFGRTLKAIREDERALKVYGYNTSLYKLTIFMIGAMIASMAGSLYATFYEFINPAISTLNESILIFVMIIMGGLASLYGSICGAWFLIMLPEALRFIGMPDEIAGYMRQIFYGSILLYFMRYRPQGLIGKYKL